MPPSYSTQYEFNEEIAARAVDLFINAPRQSLDEKFRKALRILVVFTIGGYAVCLGIDMEVDGIHVHDQSQLLSSSATVDFKSSINTFLPDIKKSR